MKNSSNPISSKLVFLALTAMFFLTGCSSFNCTRLGKLLGNDTDLIKFSYAISEALVQQASPPLIPRHPDMPILVTTPVDNNNLSKTSHFGRVLQEHITSRFVQLGFTVKEIKLANTLQINQKSGETILSRDLSKLKGAQEAQAIFAGTLSHSAGIMYISTRLINPTNSNIIATDDNRLCMDENILTMFGLQHQDNVEKPIEEPSEPFLNSVL